jgi:hypothetical protein
LHGPYLKGTKHQYGCGQHNQPKKETCGESLESPLKEINTQIQSEKKNEFPSKNPNYLNVILSV